ncbi:MAG: 1-acyl-sn-glycerol-3-phosphate acyltransferase [Bacteroidales bacterium]|nr:1-acyl-sn-glycerol-3-phosphate acyltransferase [Bacteroidales bacterium]
MEKATKINSENNRISVELFNNIEAVSFFYSLLLYVFAKPWHNLLWYKRFEVTGKEQLKNNVAYIFCPNHQNALMDAMAFVTSSPIQLVWLARADIFKSKIAKSIFTFMKILPVFRIRDGADSLGDNELIFAKCSDILNQKKSIALFPEATHWGFRKLRNTKKAAPRIAFLAAENSNFTLDVHIVPCGMYYQNYTSARSGLLLQYGKPFSISDFVVLYKENPSKAYNSLRERIESEMRPLIIDIKTEKYYKTFDEVRNIFDQYLFTEGKSERSMIQKFNADKLIIAKLNEVLLENESEIELLAANVEQYSALKNKIDINEEVIQYSSSNSLFKLGIGLIMLFILLPIFLVGYFSLLIPYFIPLYFINKKVKDKQFISSVSFGLSFFLIPAFHLIYLLIIFNSINLSLVFVPVFLFFFIFLFPFTIDYYKRVILLKSSVRFLFLNRFGNKMVFELTEMRLLIISKMKELFDTK